MLRKNNSLSVDFFFILKMTEIQRKTMSFISAIHFPHSRAHCVSNGLAPTTVHGLPDVDRTTVGIVPT